MLSWADHQIVKFLGCEDNFSPSILDFFVAAGNRELQG